jgi:hypothetical protein
MDSTTKTLKELGTIDALGFRFSVVGSGFAPKSGVVKYKIPELGLIQMVLAPFWVCTVSKTENLSLDSSFTTVIIPSPQEAKANFFWYQKRHHHNLLQWAVWL